MFSPVDRTYETQADSLEPVEIAWELTTYPTPVSDFNSDGSGSPITYMTIITDEVDPGLLMKLSAAFMVTNIYTNDRDSTQSSHAYTELGLYEDH